MRWIGVVNMTLVGLIVLAAAFFAFSGKEEIPMISIPKVESKELPKSPFAESEEFFQGIGEGILSLQWVPPQMQLPDLRRELQFFGKNARPDAIGQKESFHVGLKQSLERLLVKDSERIYLVYQGNYSPRVVCQNAPSRIGESPMWGEESNQPTAEGSGYVLSPGNQPTPLWFEAKGLSDQTLEVKVGMLDEKGAFVTSPAEFRTFQLPVQDGPKTHQGGWELGGHRVDTTLLVRQKARFVGSDLFLKQHGGEEYAYTLGKERIDFLDGPEPYSCFVAAGDFLIWKGGRWEMVGEGEETQEYPLLAVKKVDEKIISFDLWDTAGRGKVSLGLIRTRDHGGIPNLEQEIRFVGAKTWAQFIVECRGTERMTLKLNDWLVLSSEGWVKLDSVEKIDDYLNHKLQGPLFILDKMSKQNGRQVLLGHLFNAARTEMQPVELSSAPTTSVANFYRHIPSSPPILPKALELDLEGGEE